MANNSENIMLIFADAIVHKLWLMGLLKDDEKKKILDRNKVSFLS